jgi:hypothetical protein
MTKASGLAWLLNLYVPKTIKKVDSCNEKKVYSCNERLSAPPCCI